MSESADGAYNLQHSRRLPGRPIFVAGLLLRLPASARAESQCGTGQYDDPGATSTPGVLSLWLQVDDAAYCLARWRRFTALEMGYG